MATGGIFGSGISGLRVSQRALATTGHNIANAETPGYSRQRVELVPRPGQPSGAGFIGKGVEASTVERVYDAFITGQVRAATTDVAHAEQLHELSKQIDNLMASPQTGLAPMLDSFFSSLHELADDPASIPVRQVVLGEAEALVQRFHTLDRQLGQLDQRINEQVVQNVDEINVLTAKIAELNQIIPVARGAASGQPPNDLLDQRDELIRQLSERIGIQTFEQDGNFINVTTNGGQALVIGTTTARLDVVANSFNPTRNEVAYTVSGTTQIISDRISGGSLAGALDFRRQMLDEAQNSLGRIAVGLASTMNAQHRSGMDLNGAPGGDFFNPIDTLAPRVLPDANNTGAPPATINVDVSNVSMLEVSDYRLDRNGASYTLTRLSDNNVVTLSAFPTGPETVDGVSLDLSAGVIADGDSFLIQPTRFAAEQIAVALSDTRAIAAAAPIRSNASLSNTGGAEISSGAVNSVNNTLAISFTTPAAFDVQDATTGAALATGLAYVPGAPISFNGLTFDISGAPAAGDVFNIASTVSSDDPANTGTGMISATTGAAPDPDLTDPVTITFDNPPTTFTVAGATTGSPTVAVPYTSGSPISFNGWTVDISGTPDAGDSFTVVPNANGVGDNRNGLLLASLQTVNTLGNGSATYGEAYGQLVSRVGSQTQQAAVNRGAQEVILNQAIDARETVSGVNLDEEAANLLRFQQAYQASAKVIAVADEIFESLLSAVN